MDRRAITLTIKQTKKTIILLVLTTPFLLLVHLSFVQSEIYRMSILILWAILFIRAVKTSETNHSQKLKNSEIYFKIRMFSIPYLLLLLFLMSPLVSPFVYEHVLINMEHKSSYEVYHTTTALVSRNMTEYEKTYIIFEYVHNTMKNTYFSNVRIPIIGSLALYHSKQDGWFTCMRIEDYSVADILGKEKCGACREYAMLFMKMGEYANLTVRMVHDLGEDHSWDEVLLNGRWIIVDPSAGIFNASPTIYENKWGKVISYIYAVYPNGSKVDVTSRYTNTSTLVINVVNTNKKPLSGIKVYIVSHNYFQKGQYTGLMCKTNYKGRCRIKLGGGAYTLIAKSNGIIPLYGEEYTVINENQTYHKTIIVRHNILRISCPSWILTVLKGCVSILLWLSLISLNEISKTRS